MSTTRSGRNYATQAQPTITADEPIAIASAQTQTRMRSNLRSISTKMAPLRKSSKKQGESGYRYHDPLASLQWSSPYPYTYRFDCSSPLFTASFSNFTMKNIHITGCKPEEIEPLRSPTTATAAPACIWEKDWNFLHVDPAIDMILKRSPTSHLYVSGIASCCTGSSGEQAPLFVAFLLPAELGAPTNSMLLVNNQASEEQVIPFSCLGYRWKLSDDPRHNERVYYLYCNHDLASISEEEAIRHEYGTLCVVPPSDLLTSQHGKLIVDRVRFEFTDPNSDVIEYTWYPREQAFNKCINDVIECHFEDEVEENGLSIEEELPRIKKYLSQVSILLLSRNTSFYLHKCSLLTIILHRTLRLSNVHMRLHGKRRKQNWNLTSQPSTTLQMIWI